MIIERVKEINKIYWDKVRKEEDPSDHDLDILDASQQAICWYKYIGTKADLDTFGEFTRRFERHGKELEKLLEGV